MEMFAKLILFTILACFSIKDVMLVPADPEDSEVNIIGGEFANPGELPYQVGIYAGEYKSRESYTEDFKVEENVHFCGGSIIGKNFVLSAASCFVDTCDGYIGGKVCTIKNHMYVMAGVVDKTDAYQKRFIKSVNKYEEYGVRRFIPSFRSYDIALITLKQPFRYDARVKPLQLAMELPPRGTECTVSGWGEYEDPNVPTTQLKKAKYDMGFEWFDRIVFLPGYLKTGIIKARDSGGPLVCNDKLTGIISDNKIVIPAIPFLWKIKIIDILTSVVPYLSWLQENGVKIGGGA